MAKERGGDMVTTVRSLGLQGISGYEVSVECFLSSGLPAFDVVGLADTAVKEARERVRAAVKKKTIVSMISTYGVTIFLAGFTALFFAVSLVNDVGEKTEYLSYFWISLNPFAVALSVISPDIAIGIKEMTQLQLPPVVVYSIVYLLIGIVSLLTAIKKLRVTK